MLGIMRDNWKAKICCRDNLWFDFFLFMKLHQLHALVGVVTHGSIRSAARAMHLTQAALTKSLKQLEDDHGVPLLIRKASGVQLTEAGARLHVRAQMVIRQLSLAEEELQQALGQTKGFVRAGLTPYLMLTVLGEAFKWFRRRYPHVALSVVEGLVTRVVPGLRDGSMDFAVVADSGDLGSTEFERQSLFSEPQKLVVRAGHPLLRRPDALGLRACEWVVPGPHSAGLDESLRSLFTQAGIAPPDMLTRCDAMAAMALVRQSDSVCIMPSPLLGQPEGHGLVELKVPGLIPPPVQLVLISPADVPLSAPAAYFARCICDAAQERLPAER